MELVFEFMVSLFWRVCFCSVCSYTAYTLCLPNRPTMSCMLKWVHFGWNAKSRGKKPSTHVFLKILSAPNFNSWVCDRIFKIFPRVIYYYNYVMLCNAIMKACIDWLLRRTLSAEAAPDTRSEWGKFLDIYQGCVTWDSWQMVKASSWCHVLGCMVMVMVMVMAAR